MDISIPLSLRMSSRAFNLTLALTVVTPVSFLQRVSLTFLLRLLSIP